MPTLIGIASSQRHWIFTLHQTRYPIRMGPTPLRENPRRRLETARRGEPRRRKDFRPRNDLRRMKITSFHTNRLSAFAVEDIAPYNQKMVRDKLDKDQCEQRRY